MTIVVGVDLSEASQQVLSIAEQLARRLGSDVILVHVAAPEPDFVGYEIGPQNERDARASELHHQHAELNALIQRLGALGVNARARLMAGPAVDGLLEESDRAEAEMIVVGSHGHGLLYDVLVGSVAEGLLRRSRRPVLVVPIRKA